MLDQVITILVITEMMTLAGSKKEYYTVLTKIVSDWEELFWTNEIKDCPLQISDFAKGNLSCALFDNLVSAVGGYLDVQYRKAVMVYSLLNGALSKDEICANVAADFISRYGEAPERLYEDIPKVREIVVYHTTVYSEVVRELLTRISENRQEIAHYLFDTDEAFDEILKIDGDCGDAHNFGRRVFIIHTEKGSFVYKPHCVEANIYIERVIKECFDDIVAVPRVLAYNQYGFTEYVHSNRSEGIEDAKQFYHNVGGCLAVFQLFGSTDYHTENVLVKANKLILIDLETFFSPETAQKYNCYSKDTFLFDFMRSMIYSSVLPHKYSFLEKNILLCETDESILPMIDGKVTSVYDFLDDLICGFCEVYMRSLERRKQIVAIIESFADFRVRYLVRNTSLYADVLRKINELADEDKKNALYKKFLNIHSLNEEYLSSGVLSAEWKSMCRNDIPYFYTYWKSNDLYCEEKCVQKGFFELSPIDNAKDRLERLSDKEMKFEVNLIRFYLLSCRRKEKDSSIKRIVGKKRPEFAMRSNMEALYENAALRLFDKSYANRFEAPCGENGWLVRNSVTGSVEPMDVCFGYGKIGMALVGAIEYTRHPSEDVTGKIAELLKYVFLYTIQPDSEKYISVLFSNIGFVECGGLIKALGIIYRCTGMHIVKEAIDRIHSYLCDNVEELLQNRNYSVDFWSGAAGLLYVLCTDSILQNEAGNDNPVNRLADYIVSKQNLKTKFDIMTWDTLKCGRHISGLAHGCAGIGLALFAAWKYTGNEGYRKHAEDALNLERLLYCSEERNWGDYRESDTPDYSMHGLCAGAPGMALTTLRLHEMGIGKYDEMMKDAIAATYEAATFTRHHFCCGNAAIIYVLAQAGKALCDNGLLQEAKRRASVLLNTWQKTGVLRTTQIGYVQTDCDGFFFGTSGIAYTLLSLDDAYFEAMI